MSTLATPHNGKDDPTGCVQSVFRAFRLLDQLAEHSAGLTLTEVAKLVGLPRSTAHRLLTTMESMRYVTFDSTTNQWLVGARAIAFAERFSGGMDLKRLARPAMLSLLASTRVTVSMFVLTDKGICCVDQVRPSGERWAMARPGDQLPLHTTASGKMLMAHWDEPRIAARLTSGLRPRTANSLGTRPAMLAELAAIRRRGWAVDDQESVMGVRCLAAPVMNKAGEARAALSVSGRLSTLSDARIEVLSSSLVHTARQLTEDFGGTQA